MINYKQEKQWSTHSNNSGSLSGAVGHTYGLKKNLFLLLCGLALSAIILTTPAPVFSAEDVESETNKTDETTMTEVVVTATRYEERESTVPANITVITEEDIRNSTAQNVAELLRSQPGVNVVDIAGNRRSYTVDLRSFGETAPLNTLVLVDGRRVNQADLSGTDWVQIPLDRVERIEIIRGGRGSVLYGDNAAGGVINIITKKGKELKASVEVKGGSYSTIGTDASVSGSWNDLAAVLSYDYLHSDGYRDNSDTERNDVGLNLDYNPFDFLDIHLGGGYHKDDTGFPGSLSESDLAAGFNRTDSNNPDNFADVEDYYIHGTPEIYFWQDSSLVIDTSYRNRTNVLFFSSSFGNFTGTTEIETIAVSPRLLLKKDLGPVSNTLTAGFDYQVDTEDIVNDNSFSIASFDLEKETLGYYIHDNVVAIDGLFDGLSVSAGYRHDEADYDFDATTAGSRVSTKVSEDLYTAGVNYIFWQDSYIYGSYSRSFRYPVLDEFFNFFTNDIDSSLQPQRSDDYEFGVRYYYSKKSYAHLNFFRVNTMDEIFFDPIVFSNSNMDGRTGRDGFELSFHTTAVEGLSVSGSYTLTDARIDNEDFSGNDIPGVPEQQGTLSVSVSFLEKYSVSLSGHYVGKRRFVSDFNNEAGYQDDFFLLNTRLKYNRPHFSAFVDINNLLDQKYSEYGVFSTFSSERNFFPSPAINFLMGVQAYF